MLHLQCVMDLNRKIKNLCYNVVMPKINLTSLFPCQLCANHLFLI